MSLFQEFECSLENCDNVYTEAACCCKTQFHCYYPKYNANNWLYVGCKTGSSLLLKQIRWAGVQMAFMQFMLLTMANCG